MKILRIYADESGESHFEDMEIEMEEDGALSRKSAIWPVQDVHFRQIAPGGSAEWHPAPRRQFAIVLSGESNFEASDGSVRHISPGQAFLVEDTHGKGH